MKKNRPLALAALFALAAILSYGQGTSSIGGGGTNPKADTVFVGTGGVTATKAGNTVTIDGSGTASTTLVAKSWGSVEARTFVSNDALTFVQGTVENGKTLTIQAVNVTTTNWTNPTTTKVLIYDATAAATVLQVGTNWNGSVTITAGHNWYGQIINPSNTTEVVSASIHGKIN